MFVRPSTPKIVEKTVSAVQRHIAHDVKFSLVMLLGYELEGFMQKISVEEGAPAKSVPDKGGDHKHD
jgi:hypothetical protein